MGPRYLTPARVDRVTQSAQHKDILAAAVATVGGEQRPGQLQMADAVALSIASGVHTLVQAGTGTGKSLGYLAPVLDHLARTDAVIVIATATLALQAQLANKDIPTALAAVQKVHGTTPKHAILKGRTNYACLYKVRDGSGAEQDALLGGAEVAQAARTSGSADTAVGGEVVMLREWAEEQLVDGELADRDDAPAHLPRAWEQVSIPVRECLGVQRCPYGEQCFVEESRARARASQLIVTNHALLAIDAMHGGTALPEHDAVIIDEAHDLVSRVTGAATDELSPQVVERAARRVLPWVNDDLGVELLEVADTLREALDDTEIGRVTTEGTMTQAFSTVRDVTRKAVSALAGAKGAPQVDPEKSQATAGMKEVFDIAERMAKLHPMDVVWTSERERYGRWAHVAPLSVAHLMRDQVLAQHTTVLASATLKLGGDFTSIASQVGLRKADQVAIEDLASVDLDQIAEGSQPWLGLDVGSPFDYRRQGILYVAADLPNPGRDGIGPEALQEIAELVWGAGGRTLGLFASQRNAEAAARHVRAQLPELTILCQGDAQLSELTRRFVAEPEASLFGTLSLWQGIDVPGQTCELVIIDKIPFPRPDDPLMQARQQAVVDAGGNGFMSVAASHAALLLAQGTGRLIRRASDRGVIAMLDPRLVKARYGSYLRASLPDYWMTADRETAVQALKRLQEGREG